MPTSLTVVSRVARARARALVDPPWGMLILGVVLAAAMTTQATAAGASSRATMPIATLTVSGWQRAAGESGESPSPEAARLLASSGGNLERLRDAGESTLRDARNQATVAEFLSLPGSARLDAGLEQTGRLLPSTDAVQLAEAVAALDASSELIHKTFLNQGPARVIIVSLHDQHLVAYDHGSVIVDAPVTTGRPMLSTDVGLMHVLRTDSPWTMKSPWPKGSPLWYPDTPVTSVAWFTSTGEGLHDAPWEPASAFGPGSEDGPYASHGCIHLPSAAQATLFGWVTVGTPIVVIPGDGSPVPLQAAQQSVDGQGNPISGVRGA